MSDPNSDKLNITVTRYDDACLRDTPVGVKFNFGGVILDAGVLLTIKQARKLAFNITAICDEHQAIFPNPELHSAISRARDHV